MRVPTTVLHEVTSIVVLLCNACDNFSSLSRCLSSINAAGLHVLLLLLKVSMLPRRTFISMTMQFTQCDQYRHTHRAREVIRPSFHSGWFYLHLRLFHSLRA